MSSLIFLFVVISTLLVITRSECDVTFTVDNDCGTAGSFPFVYPSSTKHSDPTICFDLQSVCPDMAMTVAYKGDYEENSNKYREYFDLDVKVGDFEESVECGNDDGAGHCDDFFTQCVAANNLFDNLGVVDCYNKDDGVPIEVALDIRYTVGLFDPCVGPPPDSEIEFTIHCGAGDEDICSENPCCLSESDQCFLESIKEYIDQQTEILLRDSSEYGGSGRGHGGYRGSSDSSEEEFAAALDHDHDQYENKDSVVNDKNAEHININLDEMTLMNLWAILFFGLFVFLGGTIYIYYKQKSKL
jgi:hypothetical protein